MNDHCAVKKEEYGRLLALGAGSALGREGPTVQTP